jgi:hypothetical protein
LLSVLLGRLGEQFVVLRPRPLAQEFEARLHRRAPGFRQPVPAGAGIGGMDETRSRGRSRRRWPTRIPTMRTCVARQWSQRNRQPELSLPERSREDWPLIQSATLCCLHAHILEAYAGLYRTAPQPVTTFSELNWRKCRAACLRSLGSLTWGLSRGRERTRPIDIRSRALLRLQVGRACPEPSRPPIDAEALRNRPS